MNSPSKLPVSVCIISGNEAHRITPTLKSVVDWVMEINVVINDDVSDGTDKIVESFGGKVFREPWKGLVEQTRSASEKAGQEWILALDADEAVSPELRASIQNLFSATEKLNAYAAYEFPRCTQYYDRWIRHGEWYPDRKLRLWRRGTGRWGGTVSHPKLCVTGGIGRLRGDLLHSSMESVEHQIGKTIRYADGFVQDCQLHNRRVTFFDLLVRPPWRFFRGYVLRLGFLDGWQGLAIAWMTGFYTFLRYFKAFAVQQKNSK